MKQKTIPFLLFFILSQHLFAQCWKEVAAGEYHTLAIKTDGTLWAWGLNNFGQLGDGTTINKNVPTQIGTDTNWSIIDATGYNSIALKTDGSLWTWGNNVSGQLGDGNHGNGVYNTTPTHIGTDTDWVKIDNNGCFALKSNGTLWGWGYNLNGRLGTGEFTDHYTPYQIGTDTDWEEVSTGGNQTLALKTNHTLWGWGMNKRGSLAIGPPSESVIITTPTQTGNNTADWAKISVGGCCSSKMIKTDGSLWAMGFGFAGNLGTGNTNDVNAPTRVGIDNDWKEVTTVNHTCSIKNNNTLWSWGVNGIGQLGDGTLVDKYVPTQIEPNIIWQKVIIGSNHTVALDGNGTLYTWGWNNNGQLGDGTFIDKNVPTQIGNSCPLNTTGFNTNIMLQVYPNPTPNDVILSFNLSTTIDSEILLTNSLGQLVYNKKYTGNIGENQFPINLDTYSVGVYLITLKTATESVTVKLIKN